MSESTALLISADRALIESVHEVVCSIGNLRLEVRARIEEVLSSPPPIQAVLVLAHLTRANDTEPVTRLLRMLTSAEQPAPTLVLSDEHRPEQMLQLLRLGVVDYLSRPLNLNRLSYLIDVLTVRARSTAHVPSSASTVPVENLSREGHFLFVSKGSMGLVMEQVQRVAPQNTTVLLGGETGTGKTSLARVIHSLSPRRDKPFLVVNCGALSANLIESELFGHVKGAFTGADRDRSGKLAEVGDGTLLLDEIDALPLTLQAKLLRVLEERVFEPVGSNRTCTLQARLIVASNRNLDQEVAEGRFRSDLYYRLNVVSFTLLPLRQSRDLIAPLAERFLADFAASNGRPVRGISGETQRALQEYDWPGNIREIRNVVERAVALCAGSLVEIGDLPEAMRRSETGADVSATEPLLADSDAFSAGTLAETKDEAESLRIVTALRQHKNNRLRTAAELGISRWTLYKKLHRFGLIGAS
jgi:DNA-binding NtrC family response regulator